MTSVHSAITQPDAIEYKGPDSLFAAFRKGHQVKFGDFDSMLRRRMIRVLVPYSRTLFFNDRGRERGITADNYRAFEHFLDRKYKKQLNKIPFTVIFIPTPRDRLIPGVKEGIGDIAAGNLTETQERSRQVDFEAPAEHMTVSEIVVTRKEDGPVDDIGQLAGKKIFVRQSSSYFESLREVNQGLSRMGKLPIALDTVSENLEDEDLMEMVDAGIIPAIVVDDWKARMWAQILPNIIVNEHALVDSGKHIGPAFRKNSPLLSAELKDFYNKYEKRLSSMPYRIQKYNKEIKHLQDPIDSDNARRYKDIIKLFQKYARQYEFDPLMLAALGFQESALDQSQRSPVGAIGIMQIMPKTGAQMKVGDIRITEPNIHAGTKYMHLIMTNHFKDAHFDEFNRSLFAFASYNAGPARIARLRKLAANRGYNPDLWLDNVEIVVSEKIGRETTTYVRNIMKYYYSYKLMGELGEEKRKQRQSF